MNRLQCLVPALILAMLPVLCYAQEKPRIAVLQLKAENAGHLEVSVMTHLIQNYFVNTHRYTVLERQDIDKILGEQSAAGMPIKTDAEAARFGKLLNVQ